MPGIIYDTHRVRNISRYQFILLGLLFRCENLLRLKCLNIKFHNYHHIILQPPMDLVSVGAAAPTDFGEDSF